MSKCIVAFTDADNKYYGIKCHEYGEEMGDILDEICDTEETTADFISNGEIKDFEIDDDGEIFFNYQEPNPDDREILHYNTFDELLKDNQDVEYFYTFNNEMNRWFSTKLV